MIFTNYSVNSRNGNVVCFWKIPDNWKQRWSHARPRWHDKLGTNPTVSARITCRVVNHYSTVADVVFSISLIQLCFWWNNTNAECLLHQGICEWIAALNESILSDLMRSFRNFDDHPIQLVKHDNSPRDVATIELVASISRWIVIS